ncbi:uncharacterized protein LOC144340589 [Macaca mulatta]
MARAGCGPPRRRPAARSRAPPETVADPTEKAPPLRGSWLSDRSCPPVPPLRGSRVLKLATPVLRPGPARGRPHLPPGPAPPPFPCRAPSLDADPGGAGPGPAAALAADSHEGLCGHRFYTAGSGASHAFCLQAEPGGTSGGGARGGRGPTTN